MHLLTVAAAYRSAAAVAQGERTDCVKKQERVMAERHRVEVDYCIGIAAKLERLYDSELAQLGAAAS